MNFRQRLINVLTVLMIIGCFGGVGSEIYQCWYNEYVSNLYLLGLVLAASIVSCVVPSGIGFLIGVGFKTWHK